MYISPKYEMRMGGKLYFVIYFLKNMFIGSNVDVFER